MKKYTHIIVALELDLNHEKELLQKTKQIIQQNQAVVSLIHTIEHHSSYGASYGLALGVEIEHNLIKCAKQQMEHVSNQLDCNVSNTFIDIGMAKYIILEEADKLQCDLIILGSHGHKGITKLLGSTTQHILNKAKCDVLSVQLGPQ